MSRQPAAGVITTFAPQARKRKYLGDRVNVFIDGQFSFALDISLVEKYQLACGQLIDDAFLSHLLREDGEAKARAAALHFIGYRPRSLQEVRQRLNRDGWPEALVAQVVQRLENEGVLGDESFSAQWVESRTLHKPRGSRALRQELRSKGVERDTIEAALPREHEEADNALTAARFILKSKARNWSTLDERARRDKFLQAMQRRGFSFPVAKQSWDRIHDEDEADLT